MADLDRFDHGDLVVMGPEGFHVRVFRARWWHVWRWVLWLAYAALGRTILVTLTDGGRMRAVLHGTQHKGNEP